jgi:hypothetical protein
MVSLSASRVGEVPHRQWTVRKLLKLQYPFLGYVVQVVNPGNHPAATCLAIVAGVAVEPFEE